MNSKIKHKDEVQEMWRMDRKVEGVELLRTCSSSSASENTVKKC